MNRRQFFKRVAATCVGIGAAAVAAPTVLASGKKPLPFKPNPMQQEMIRGQRAKHIFFDFDAPVEWRHYIVEIPYENPQTKTH